MLTFSSTVVGQFVPAWGALPAKKEQGERETARNGEKHEMMEARIEDGEQEVASEE